MIAAICYSADWAEHVRVQVYALQKTNPGVWIYLISDADGKMKIPDCTFIDVEALFKKRIPSTINVDTRFTKYSLYRLLLPEIIDDSKVLYLDADTLVVDDIEAFWAFGLLGNALVAGVQDVGVTEGMLAECDLVPGDVYINAGVTLLNLEQIYAADLYETWLREINTKHYDCHDQGIINKTCKGRISVVGNRYNSSLSCGFSENPRIVHFAGPIFMKPWRNTEVRHAELWRKWVQMYQDDACYRRKG